MSEGPSISRRPYRSICLHRGGFWIFRRYCGRLVDAEGRCPIHGYEEDIHG